jgi:hypothetical protein
MDAAVAGVHTLAAAQNEENCAREEGEKGQAMTQGFDHTLITP